MGMQVAVCLAEFANLLFETYTTAKGIDVKFDPSLSLLILIQ